MKTPISSANWGLYRYASLILLPETQFFDEFAIALQIVLAEVGKQALTLTNQLHQAAVGAEILLVLLQVSRKCRNTLSQQCDLTFDGTSVLGVATISFENLGFLFNG